MARVTASCHCRAIRFEAPAPERLTTCNCSYCDRRGALWAYCDADDFTLRTARDRAATYQCADYIMEHHHCAVCGCPAWSWTPALPDWPGHERPRICWNVRLAEDFDRSGLPVDRVDGRAL